MYLPNPELQKQLNDLHAEFRFTSIAPGVVKDGQGGFEPDDDKPGCICAEIQDKTTGEFYAKGTGEDHDTALKNAIAAAHTTAKPLTPAQKADGTIARQNDEIAALKRQLAEARGETPESTEPKRGRGRSRKPVTVPDDQEDGNVHDQ